MSKRSTWSPERRARERKTENERRARTVREHNPNLPPYEPRALRGPATAPHYVPAGLELSGVSRLKDARGRMTAEWDKSRTAGAEPAKIPEGFNVDHVSLMTRADGSEVIRWTGFDPDKQAQWEDFWVACDKNAANYTGLALPVSGPDRVYSDLMTVYPIGDPHIGMLAWAPECGEHFDTKIAVRELRECMTQLVDRSPPSERATIIQLGDFFHAQDDSARTPKSGHKLDTDGRFARTSEAGHTVLRSIVDLALQKHRFVTIVNMPGNHDPRVAYELGAWL